MYASMAASLLMMAAQTLPTRSEPTEVAPRVEVGAARSTGGCATRVSSPACRVATGEVLAAPRLLGPEDWIEEGVVLHLAPEVLDDHNRIGPPSSVADVIHDRLQDGELEERLFQMLPQPLTAFEDCRRQVLDRCMLRVGARASSLDVGDVELGLEPVEGGMALQLEVTDIELPVELLARVAALPISSRGVVTVGRVRLKGRIAFEAGRGGFRTGVVGTPVVEVMSIDSNFRGLDGAVLDAVFKVIAPVLERALEEALTEHLVPLADEALVVLLGKGRGAVWERALLREPRGLESQLVLQARLSGLEPDPTGVELRFDVRVGNISAPVHPPVGIVAGARARPGLEHHWSDAAVGIDLAVVNQALHALWQSGAFDMRFEAGALGPGLPADTELRVRPRRPPVLVATSEHRLELQIGEWQIDIDSPELFARNLHAELHARASFELRAQGSRLVRGPLRYESLELQIENSRVGAVAAEIFRPWLRDVVARAADQAAALVPASVPLPSVNIPELARLGPSSSSLVLQLELPRLHFEGQHAILVGELRALRDDES